MHVVLSIGAVELLLLLLLRQVAAVSAVLHATPSATTTDAIPATAFATTFCPLLLCRLPPGPILAETQLGVLAVVKVNL